MVLPSLGFMANGVYEVTRKNFAVARTTDRRLEWNGTLGAAGYPAAAPFRETVTAMSTNEDSVQQWIEALKRGESDHARRLFQEVYQRMVRLARRRLGAQSPRWVDEEDVALSAFDSFCRRAGEDRFPTLKNRDDLWKILLRITSRKAKDYLRAHRTLKRGGGEVRGDSAIADAELRGAMPDGGVEHQTPHLVAVVAEQCRRMLAALDDDTARSIALWKLEGYTDVEIADRLGCVPRTVVRKSNRIRDIWKRLGDK
jgi:DNA-directed RNA polymerase specialized sigma24 family protein